MVPIIVGIEGVFEGPSEVFWYGTKFPENQPSTSRKKAFMFKGARLRMPSGLVLDTQKVLPLAVSSRW